MKLIVGADECGTGALAGPFVVCAVLVPETWSHPLLADSKALSEKQRLEAQLFANLEALPHFFGFGWHDDIDRYGHRPLLVEVYQQVLNLAWKRAFWDGDGNARTIVDGNMDLGPQVQSVVKADATIPAVMAASILGKVKRDRLMREEVHPLHPMYGFNDHVGYGVPAHLEALRKFGPCAAHRMSCKPVKALLQGASP